MPLRPYQQKIVEDCRAAFKQSHTAPCVVLWMSGGKTKTAMSMVESCVKQGGKVVWLAHREELIKQAREDAPVECGVVAAGLGGLNKSAPLQICMIQTLNARNLRPQANLCIVDECHHAVADEYKPLILHYPNRIGLTATPARSDGRGLEEVFDCLVEGPPVDELIKQGFVLPCRIKLPPKPLGPKEIAQCPVEAYLEHCQGLKTIVFAANIKAAKEYHEKFQQHGVRSAIVHSQTSYDARVRAVLDLRDGDIEVLVNVFVFTEGFNEPSLGAVILARGFQTPGPYLQAAGRGMRPDPDNPAKTEALIVDLRGITWIHGAPDVPRDFSLEGLGIRTKIKDGLAFCPICGQPIDPNADQCQKCLREKSETESPTVVNVKLEPYAAKRRENDSEKSATLARYIIHGRINNHKPGAAFFKYKAVYGIGPTPQIVAQARSLTG